MEKREWRFMEILEDELPPDATFHQSHSERIGRQIIKSSRVGADMRSKAGATAIASILIDMKRYDKVIVKPNDIEDAARRTTTTYSELTVPEIKLETIPWLRAVELIEVVTSYSEQLSDYEKIWVAPIFPDLNDICEELGEPVALSTSTIRDILTDAFEQSDSTDDNSFVSESLDNKEVNAFLSHILYELDENWAPVDGTENKIWINLDDINKILFEKSGKTSNEEIIEKIIRVLNEANYIDKGLVPNEIDTNNIGSIMIELQQSHNLRHLKKSTEIHWYNDGSLFNKDYIKYAEEAQKIVDKEREATLNELQKARMFFEYNRHALLNNEVTTEDQIDYVVRKLDNWMKVKKKENKLESATPKDDMKSTVTSKTLSEYYVAKEFEEKLKELKEKEEEDSDNKEDKGVRFYRY